MKPNKEGVHLLTDKASSSKKVCQRFSEILAVNSRIDKHLENFIFGGQMGLKQLQQLPELPLKRFTLFPGLPFTLIFVFVFRVFVFVFLHDHDCNFSSGFGLIVCHHPVFIELRQISAI